LEDGGLAGREPDGPDALLGMEVIALFRVLDRDASDRLSLRVEQRDFREASQSPYGGAGVEDLIGHCAVSRPRIDEDSMDDERIR
jgi:hypothetical protein